jgi:hypothetical protein
VGGGSRTQQTTQPRLTPAQYAMDDATALSMLSGLNAAPMSNYFTPTPQQIAPINAMTAMGAGSALDLMDPNNPATAYYRSVLGGQDPSSQFLTTMLGGQDPSSQFLTSMLRGEDPSSNAYRSIIAGQDPGSQYMTGQLQAPLGQSPDTQAAMNAWNALVRPQVQNQMGLAGLGRSGALGDALSLSETQAVVPFLQQEIANRQQSAQALPGLQMQAAGMLPQTQFQAAGMLPGQQMQAAGMLPQIQAGAAQALPSLESQQMQAGISTGDYLRNIQQQQLDAPYQDFLRRQALSENLLSGGAAIMPSTFGSTMAQMTHGPGVFGSLYGGSK